MLTNKRLEIHQIDIKSIPHEGVNNAVACGGRLKHIGVESRDQHRTPLSPSCGIAW
jgi:hypothetical protein